MCLLTSQGMFCRRTSRYRAGVKLFVQGERHLSLDTALLATGTLAVYRYSVKEMSSAEMSSARTFWPLPGKPAAG